MTPDPINRPTGGDPVNETQPTSETPEVVPYQDRERSLSEIAAGKAVRFDPESPKWIVEDVEGVVSREFDTEDNARAFWLSNGGALIRRVETSWILVGDWAERVEASR